MIKMYLVFVDNFYNYEEIYLILIYGFRLKRLCFICYWFEI